MKILTSILKWVLLFSVVTIFLSPGVGDDSQVYHLPGIVNILKSGSLVNFDPEQLYRPAAFMNYYPRGFEAIGAVFYAMPFSGPLMTLFKLALFASVYLLFVRQSGNKTVGLTLLVFLISMQVVRDDLGNLKNDLVMAVPLFWAAATACAPRGTKNGLWLIPLCCSFSMTVKSSALLYSAPVLLLWLWKFRAQWGRQLLAIFGIILPFGLFFYWANWIFLGNPIYPFEVSLGRWVLVSGQQNNLFRTTIMANLDSALPLMFLRGLLRVAGPGGVAALLGAGFWVLGACFWRPICRKKAQKAQNEYLDGMNRIDRIRRAWRMAHGAWMAKSPNPPTAYSLTPNAFLIWAIWLFAFLITPFSDRNSAVPHNLLYSGGTIRLAFPAIFLLFWAIARPLSEWVGQSEKRKGWLLAGAALAALVNLFWYDTLCCFMKPENALAWVAPVVKSFNNWVLAGWVLAIAALCAAGIASKRKWSWAVLVIGAIAVQQLGYPESLGYTMRFKQIGQSSRVFEYLKEQGFTRHDTVAIHSADESSFFLASVNDYLLPRAGRVVYVDDSSSNIQRPTSNNPNWIILCAKDAFELDGRVQGRHYRASWDFLDGQALPSGYEEVFRNKFYRVLRKQQIEK